MRVERREVPARARRDPAAERRELERPGKWRSLRPCSRELLLEARAARAGLDPRGARDVVDLEHPVEAPQVDRDRAGVAVPDRGLDPADDARCRRRTESPPRRRRRTTRAARTTSLLVARERDDVAADGRSARGRRAPRRGTTCRRSARRARRCPCVQIAASAAGGSSRGAGSSTSVDRRPAARRPRRRSRGAPGLPRRPRAAPSPTAARPRSPSPRTCGGGWRASTTSARRASGTRTRRPRSRPAPPSLPSCRVAAALSGKSL